ncbi:MAG: PQQ-dependent sugar dehydrogenase [Anaerolineae bacterium]|nr:PQQ-dependent sugar dehydrogenase [Anaerolineae bacterium]
MLLTGCQSARQDAKVALTQATEPSPIVSPTPVDVSHFPLVLKGVTPWPSFTPTPTLTATPTPVPTATPAFDPAGLHLRLEPVASGLASPVGVTQAGDGTGRLFVVEKRGTIRIVRGGTVVAPPFLDITPLVRSSGFEQGLLGLAFHPRYRDNGLFFVNYTNRDGNTVIARYRVSSNSDRADPDSAVTVLGVDQPYSNHNAGHLAFGPDGYLWVGLGDGGSGGDPRGNGQNPAVLLGKMLRLDVDSGEPYRVPPDNPFVGRTDYRPEIWARGLRNPWRYSFDRVTGDLYIADVGQGEWEEVNFTPAASRGGENYGWKIMEGTHCYSPSSGCNTAGLTLPVTEYSHDFGCSVTGGYVYRGRLYPHLWGAYLFGDFCSGRLWTLYRTAEGRWVRTEMLQAGHDIAAFGEDEAGEVYIVSLNQGLLERVTVAP